MHVSELFSEEDLLKAIEDKLVTQRKHPQFDLWIYNYTPQAQYSRTWNDVTINCRGLILDGNADIVARPFKKFFNYGEEQVDLAPDTPVKAFDKADGCFLYNTKLALWDGSTMKIGDIVKDRKEVTLIGMDSDGNLVPSKVIDWHNNGQKENWMDIIVDSPVSLRSGGANHPNKMRVTSNHHIYVNGEYKPAVDIKVGDTLVTRELEYDEVALHMIESSLLGDGCIVKSNNKKEWGRYQESHSYKQKEYVEELRAVLGAGAVNRSDTKSGYGSSMCWVGSSPSTKLKELRDKWYANGRKVIPEDLSWMDDYSVAKWLMDDGHRQKFKAQADRISFATNSFTSEEITRLGNRLVEMYGVSYHIVNDGGRGYALVVNSGRKKQIHTLWARIAPYVHPSMRYKIPEIYHEVEYISLRGSRDYIPVATKVLKIDRDVENNKKNFPSGRVGFDISTETENYMANGIIVHNSLGIIYPTPDGKVSVATRGSFESDQALCATDHLKGKGMTQDDFMNFDEYTYLAEIVGSFNRIVLDYGDFEGLIGLACVDIETGVAIDPLPTFAFDRYIQHFPEVKTLKDALEVEPRKNAEGLVLRMEDGSHLKCKQADYVEAHRIVSNLSERAIWEALVRGDVDELISSLPDEFYNWASEIKHRLTVEKMCIASSALDAHRSVVESLPEGYTRKEFAQKAVQFENKSALFLLEDGREEEVSTWAWNQIRP